jgi:hypothetical protein
MQLLPEEPRSEVSRRPGRWHNRAASPSPGRHPFQREPPRRGPGRRHRQPAEGNPHMGLPSSRLAMPAADPGDAAWHGMAWSWTRHPPHSRAVPPVPAGGAESSVLAVPGPPCGHAERPGAGLPPCRRPPRRQLPTGRLWRAAPRILLAGLTRRPLIAQVFSKTSATSAKSVAWSFPNSACGTFT